MSVVLSIYGENFSLMMCDGRMTEYNNYSQKIFDEFVKK